jgi:hypothetical protein
MLHAASFPKELYWMIIELVLLTIDNMGISSRCKFNTNIEDR